MNFYLLGMKKEEAQILLLLLLLFIKLESGQHSAGCLITGFWVREVWRRGSLGAPRPESKDLYFSLNSLCFVLNVALKNKPDLYKQCSSRIQFYKCFLEALKILISIHYAPKNGGGRGAERLRLVINVWYDQEWKQTLTHKCDGGWRTRTSEARPEY